ncbi:unnamed protein product [Zymoseptoria tritici ST99CH_3D7]|uniref:alpha-1,2-Mannosidase n=2 Tax=Zymoseptoria tritici TaxID=1047171 RepID=A0A1X7RCT1_ZYMT9|nr:unnamed protein product [Zymoseptoria tritici ST99CH_3D7]
MLSLILLSLAVWPTVVKCMTDDTIASLRQDTQDLFYHGYDNYLAHAFPEDELRPIACKPQTRNRDNPADIGLNDVLGNYSLTLIDSLSTLAILASEREEGRQDKRQPLRDFQDGIQSLVELYGGGTDSTRCGTRACGFDLDSKVQVFETNIRGVGGLLSAHLFAIGELPIRGYSPVWKKGKNPGIRWRNGLVYNGQLLNLAHDLASRLLPAFSTSTDIPYPRVNLRTGIPFYLDTEGFCRADGSQSEPREITENCAAGAGSLVLEFSTLSRLTGDMRFENLGKRAFWAIWKRRSAIGLIGNGIDAESGLWTNPPLAGIGAGIDSFFEYSLKSHILLSNLPYDPANSSIDSPDNFLRVWEGAHAAVKRHIYRKSHHDKYPYYAQVDAMNGAPRYNWVDNLSAYYPGLLVLAGKLDEAIESHLLFSALWTRYSALPERWHVPNAYIDPHFRHWAGRPEFIESTFHLFQATKDPYYLHTGEMALRDIRRRCWTKCGWADLGDVNTGEQRDRMESFFLGETAKYLYLLFSEDHPLNKLDRAVVFTTEGHPLVIPSKYGSPSGGNGATKRPDKNHPKNNSFAPTCSVPQPPMPFTISNVVNRSDFFHAAAVAQLHMVPINPVRSSALMKSSPLGPGISLADVRSPTNYTFFPWTLSKDLIPINGLSSPVADPVISTLTFPLLSSTTNPETDNGLPRLGALHKLADGILINSLSNLRLNMIQEPKSILLPMSDGSSLLHEVGEEYRIHGIANWALGRDERVLLTSDALKAISPGDPHFTRVKDLEMLDLIIDIPLPAGHQATATPILVDVDDSSDAENTTLDNMWDELEGMLSTLLGSASAIERVKTSLQTPRPTSSPSSTSPPQHYIRHSLPAILPSGPGAAPLPAILDEDAAPAHQLGKLPLKKIFWLDGQLCEHRLPSHIAQSYQVLVIKRGGCSFNEKLANVPAVSPPSIAAGNWGEDVGLGLVIVVSEHPVPSPHDEDNGTGQSVPSPGLIKPYLEKTQRTPAGIERHYPLAMVMVEGSTPLKPISVAAGGPSSSPAREVLRRASAGQGKFDEETGEFVDQSTTHKAGEAVKGGLGVKRRFWFESLGVVIGNLGMI